MVSKILNIIGTGLILVALYIRFVQGTMEPAYTLGLAGAGLIAVSQWRMLRGR